ncbi:YbfB/YjiJ family MFS transporter [Actinophytocola glycyrrhizae]|uniref:YbfB/YjiJ family MFS transporter n=1 Tax=Actinophytocola glycyrrhizae TaxID=2044873 RepID=A0ABV9S0J7_9PSEU
MTITQTRTVWHLSVAGLAAIGVSFGFARYGFGLFLPDLRATFGLDVATVGLIGSGTYAGYLAALTLVGLLSARLGPRPLIIAAGACATAGLALVAVADSTPVLVAGLLLAGTSSGWAWAPYSDVVRTMVAPDRQERVLAMVPNGTAFGTAVAGVLALAVPWRPAWVLFAGAALAVTLYNAWLLRGLPRPQRVAAQRIRPTAAAVPLFASAFSYGVVGSVYWTFAVDMIAADAPGDAVGPLFWTLIGVAGLGGLLTGRALTVLGLRRTHALLFGALAFGVAVLALAPGALPAIGLSALLYGPAFMAVAAMLTVWSYRVFPARPAAGFSAVVFCLGLGTIAGPATLGAFASGHGLPAAFLLTAAVTAATIAARPATEHP